MRKMSRAGASRFIIGILLARRNDGRVAARPDRCKLRGFGEACLDLILAGFGSPQKMRRAIQPDPKPFEAALPQYDRLLLKPRSDGAL
jgi:hypothetical protein